jgi:hypothetical protein
MPGGSRLAHLGIVVLICEKVLQHLITAAVLAVDAPSVGSPDLGRAEALGEPTMAVLNTALAILFAFALYGRLRNLAWYGPLLVGLAAFDIVAELVLHDGVFITVSLVVAVVLLVLLRLETRGSRGHARAGRTRS